MWETTEVEILETPNVITPTARDTEHSRDNFPSVSGISHYASSDKKENKYLLFSNF